MKIKEKLFLLAPFKSPIRKTKKQALSLIFFFVRLFDEVRTFFEQNPEDFTD